MLAQTRGGSVSYVLSDGQGSVRQLANSVGEVTDTYRYDAYGTVTSHSGTTTEPYGYDSQRLDSTSGLYQLRAREYDPTTGRFTTRDTAALSSTDVAELDPYVYAGANPINMSDPSGHGFLDYALETAVSIGGAYVAAVDLSEALALLFTEGAIDEAAAAAGADTAVVWVGTVLRAVWDVYHLVTDLSTFIHVLQQLYQILLNIVTSGLLSGGSMGGAGVRPVGGPGWPSYPPNNPPSPAARPAVVMQLQQGRNTYQTIKLFGYNADYSGVSVKQGESALIILRSNPYIPATDESQRLARDQLYRAIAWLRQLPPAGLCGQGNMKFEWFYKGKEWRYDVQRNFGCNFQF